MRRQNFNYFTPSDVQRWASGPAQVSMRLFLTVLILIPFLVGARHVNPPVVSAITNNHVRYVVPNNEGRRAYVEAWDLQTGLKLWSKTVFTHWYVPLLTNEYMHYEWIKSMALVNEDLVLTSERGRVYKLNIRTQSVRLSKGQPNPSLERTRTSRSDHPESFRQWRLVRAAHADCSAGSHASTIDSSIRPG